MANNDNKKTLIQVFDAYWTRQLQRNDEKHKANEGYRQFVKRQTTTGNDMALRSALRKDYIRRNSVDPAFLDFLLKRRAFFRRMAQRWQMWMERIVTYDFEQATEDREQTMANLEAYYEKARRAAADYDVDILNVEAERMKSAKSDDPSAFIL